MLCGGWGARVQLSRRDRAERTHAAPWMARLGPGCPDGARPRLRPKRQRHSSSTRRGRLFTGGEAGAQAPRLMEAGQGPPGAPADPEVSDPAPARRGSAGQNLRSGSTGSTRCGWTGSRGRALPALAEETPGGQARARSWESLLSRRRRRDLVGRSRGGARGSHGSGEQG